MSYPDNFLKGLSDKDSLTSDGFGVSASVFYFHSQHVRDGWLEQSICWEDDANVIALMLGQKKGEKGDGEIQFKAGLVRVARSYMDYINKVPSRTKGLLSYERKALNNNPYHGNLLLKENTHKYIMKIVAAAIASYAEVINRE